MVAAVIARGWIASAAILPWLVLLPLHGVAAVLAQSVTLVAAFHGAGLIVARLARGPGSPPPDAVLAIPWGAAALVAASGLATAFQLGTLELHASLVFGCAAVHTAALAIRYTDRVARAEDALGAPAAWLVPGALLVAIGATLLVAAAADGLVQPFDDDGHFLAQLARLLETGALGDPIGYARDHQLGGQVALGALAAAASESFAARLVESLAFPLTLALALSRIGGRGAGAALWRMLVVIAASALALAPLDPHPSWTAAGLALALYVTVADLDPAPPPPVALLAGALVVLRFELVPLAAAGVWVAWWRDRANHRRTAVLLLGVAAVLLPFAIARAAAWSNVWQGARALVRAPHGGWLVRAALALAIAVPSAFLLQLVVPASRALRWAGIATACALGGVATGATGVGAYSLRFAWPIGLAFALLAIIEITRTPHAGGESAPRRELARLAAGPAAPIVVLLLCVLLYEGREAPGRLRWSRRLTSAASAIDQLQRPPAKTPDPYRALLAGVPAGATVAVWVGEPERLDYARFRIIDLRTPAGARLRTFRWEDHRSRLEALVAQVRAAYLLVEADDAHVLRTQTDLLYRLACGEPSPICDDGLDAIARHHPIVAEHAGVRLLDLRR